VGAVDSEKNKGTSVKVYLPQAEGNAAAPHSERSAARQAGTETIILVEDNAEVRRFAAAVLERVGFAVLTAGSGPEAVAVAASHSGPIDLLLTDVILPGANGREIAERLKADRPGLAVLFISGYAQNVIATEGVIQEGVDFLQKPFNTAALCTRVREVLQKHNQAIRVLLVDDDAAILGLLKQMLENSGYSVETAANGKLAMSAFERQPADVVICDLVMPEWEGLETIRRLREVDPAVRIIAMSGYFAGQFLHTAQLLGADATLLKPVSGPELLRLLRQVLWERKR
jgi:CheY-like chemotaxis protein